MTSSWESTICFPHRAWRYFNLLDALTKLVLSYLYYLQSYPVVPNMIAGIQFSLVHPHRLHIKEIKEILTTLQVYVRHRLSLLGSVLGERRYLLIWSFVDLCPVCKTWSFALQDLRLPRTVCLAIIPKMTALPGPTWVHPIEWAHSLV